MDTKLHHEVVFEVVEGDDHQKCEAAQDHREGNQGRCVEHSLAIEILPVNCHLNVVFRWFVACQSSEARQTQAYKQVENGTSEL